LHYYQPRHASPVRETDSDRSERAARIMLADQTLADAYARLQSGDDDPHAFAAAIATARDCIAEITTLSRQTHRDLILAQYERDVAHSRKPNQDWRPEPEVRETIPDLADGHLRPDPATAQSAAEYVECLRNYRIWAGKPSFRVMERRCGRRFAASTICTALRGGRLPSQEMIVAIVTACGGPEEHLREFAAAWRRLVNSAQDSPR
jgi:hypothetical protein